ncbi:hypothetical protein WFQ12_21840 [Yersinia enterocolitica]|nr:hypothetical protein [Yersinia enterocolitica]HEI6794433.1 hypothetical protein [Yersinia enterocolitica]
MKELDRFTSQRLESLCDYRPNRVTNLINFREIAALAQIALAAKRAEPVGYLEQNHLDYLRSGSDADIWPEGGAGDIPVYLAPQLNSPEIPEGWKLVPIEPTRQMMSQGHFAMGGTDRGKFMRIYQAMLAAAPEKENG